MAQNLGFGAFDPVPFAERDPRDAPKGNVVPPRDTPPLPRAKPEPEAIEAWLKTPEGKAEAERIERELEEWSKTPESQRRQREILRMLREGEPEHELPPQRSGVDI